MQPFAWLLILRRFWPVTHASKTIFNGVARIEMSLAYVAMLELIVEPKKFQSIGDRHGSTFFAWNSVNFVATQEVCRSRATYKNREYSGKFPDCSNFGDFYTGKVAADCRTCTEKNALSVFFEPCRFFRTDCVDIWITGNFLSKMYWIGINA